MDIKSESLRSVPLVIFIFVLYTILIVRSKTIWKNLFVLLIIFIVICIFYVLRYNKEGYIKIKSKIYTPYIVGGGFILVSLIFLIGYISHIINNDPYGKWMLGYLLIFLIPGVICVLSNYIHNKKV